MCVCVCVCVCVRACTHTRALTHAQSCLTLSNPRDCSPHLSMRFSKQEYWSGLPFPIPRDLPNSGIKPASLASPALAGSFFTTEPEAKSIFKRGLKGINLLAEVQNVHGNRKEDIHIYKIWRQFCYQIQCPHTHQIQCPHTQSPI